MQLISEFYSDINAYVEGQLHLTVRAPSRCGHCQCWDSLCPLGYYGRWVVCIDRGGQVVRILVRRFRCMGCGKTTSILPGFAQPHHLLSNALIDAYLSEPSGACAQIQRYEGVWKGMLRRFERFQSRLLCLIGNGLGADPPVRASGAKILLWMWHSCQKSFKSLTAMLTRGFHCTAFGQYRCHKTA